MNICSYVHIYDNKKKLLRQQTQKLLHVNDMLYTLNIDQVIR